MFNNYREHLSLWRRKKQPQTGLQCFCYIIKCICGFWNTFRKVQFQLHGSPFNLDFGTHSEMFNYYRRHPLIWILEHIQKCSITTEDTLQFEFWNTPRKSDIPKYYYSTINTIQFVDFGNQTEMYNNTENTFQFGFWNNAT